MEELSSGFTLSSLEDHLDAPRGWGRLGDSRHCGSAGGAPCGDLVRLAVRVEGETVVDAGFDAHGCAAARAAGSAVVELVLGAPLLEAARLQPAAVAAELGGLSPKRAHAAELAADALHGALGAACADGAAELAPRAGRTLVAMSGGVDSAVAAQLALDRGDEVVAVTLELWSDSAGDGEKSCCSPQAVVGARALAHRMGLPHITLDMRDAFRRRVVDDFVAGHAAGDTPNPCVRCNGLVRFDGMLELAGRLGAARLATGHYARVAHDPEGALVRRAADPAKDQSYMLARVDPAHLASLDFPLGELTKPEVRDIARANALPVAERPESQDLCFLAGTDGRSFLRRHGGPAPAPRGGRRGQIVDLRGRVVGTHDGQHLFTVGQRRGIGVSGPVPLYVVRKDAARDRVVVGPRTALARRRVEIGGAVLYRDGAEVDAVKLRYRSRAVPCRIESDAGRGRHRRLTLELETAVDGVAPGQVACLLRDDVVVGLATIRASAHTGDEPPARAEETEPLTREVPVAV